MFFRQKYKEYSSVTFIQKDKIWGTCRLRNSTSFLSLIIPPCLFQFQRKYKKNSILIQNTNTFIEKYLKIIEIFIKKLNTSIWHYTNVKRKKLLFKN